VEMVQPAVAAIVNMVAGKRVGHTLPQQLSVSSPELSETSVRSARLRVTGALPNYSIGHFVWIMVEHTTVKSTEVHFVNSQGEDRHITVPTDGEVDGLFARTNDMDFEVGYPPSYWGHTPVQFAQDLATTIVDFLKDNLRNLTSAELLVQIETEGHSGPINLVTDSQKGWESLRLLEQIDSVL